MSDHLIGRLNKNGTKGYWPYSTTANLRKKDNYCTPKIRNPCKRLICKGFSLKVVGAEGFEPPTPCL